MLIHARWIQTADDQQLERWWELLPVRRPLIGTAGLADLVRGAPRPISAGTPAIAHHAGVLAQG